MIIIIKKIDLLAFILDFAYISEYPDFMDRSYLHSRAFVTGVHNLRTSMLAVYTVAGIPRNSAVMALSIVVLRCIKPFIISMTAKMNLADADSDS